MITIDALHGNLLAVADEEGSLRLMNTQHAASQSLVKGTCNLCPYTHYFRGSLHVLCGGFRHGFQKCLPTLMLYLIYRGYQEGSNW